MKFGVLVLFSSALLGFSSAWGVCSQPKEPALPEFFDLSTLFQKNRIDSIKKEELKVRGYIRAGVDGWHSICSISDSSDLDEVNLQIWINSAECTELFESRSFKEGFGIANGEFLAFKEPVYISGQLFFGELSEAEISWVSCPEQTASWLLK